MNTKSINYSPVWRILMLMLLAATQSSCVGGGSSSISSFTIGGTVSGLAAGTTLVLQDNGVDSLAVSTNGAFAFSKSIQSGGAYAVTVSVPATAQTCTVTGGSGMVTTANVSNVGVSCAPTTYSIGGTISGLTAGSVAVLNNNGGDAIALSANGSFKFSTPITTGSAYQVTVATQPTDQKCIVSNGAGTVANSNISNVLVQCPSLAVLHTFGGALDGQGPEGGPVLASDGNFYGTTSGNGSTDFGTVFRITPAGDETVLWHFGSGTDGAEPLAGLSQSSDGALYGTTFYGGLYNGGTVFKISLDGDETVLWNFGQGTDGAAPHANVIEGTDGFVYGTTQGGGSFGHGTVFRVSPGGAETVLWNFGTSTNDGTQPLAPLIQVSDGTFYGTTFTGGLYNMGTVFKLTPSGASILWNFGAAGDGASPVGGLTQGSDGALYGATQQGVGEGFYGTGFRITTAGDETVLWYFSDHFDLGVFPQSTLVLGRDGSFYGTTSAGGSTSGGQGGIYRVTPDGVTTALWAFTFPNEGPIEGVVEGSDGAFYGTTVGYQNASGITPPGRVYKLSF
jgi:uncharacterized repeat protein (TIGR03803 family)